MNVTASQRPPWWWHDLYHDHDHDNHQHHYHHNHHDHHAHHDPAHTVPGGAMNGNQEHHLARPEQGEERRKWEENWLRIFIIQTSVQSSAGLLECWSAAESHPAKISIFN